MTTQVSMEIEVVDGVMHLVITGTNATEHNEAKVPLTAEFARYLSSRLLGAAAVVDPAGHQAILEGIAALVECANANPSTAH